MRTGKTFLKIGLFMCLSVSALAVEKPLFPKAFTDNTGRLHLFWFYPGLHEFGRGNIDRIPELQICPGTAEKQYFLTIRLGIDPPMMIRDIKAFIWNFDPYPDYPGDQYTPLMFYLQDNLIPDDTAFLWSMSCGLNPPANAGGDYVAVYPEYSITNQYDCWVSLGWDVDYRGAPVVGGLPGKPDLEQYICSDDGTGIVIEESQDNYMVGVDLLGWRGGKIPDSLSALSFEIYYGEDSVYNPDDLSFLAMIGPEELHALLQNPREGYYWIMAGDGDIISIPMAVYFNPNQSLPLEIIPTDFEQVWDYRKSNNFAITVLNNASQSRSLKFSADRQYIELSDNQLFLGSGESGDINFSVKTESLTDTAFMTYMIISESGESCSELYRLKFIPPDPTAVDENESTIPIVFEVSEGYPNPFNASIGFEINGFITSDITVDIYNILGRRIYSDHIGDGHVNRFIWDVSDQGKSGISSGLYFFRFDSGRRSEIRSGLLIK
nr:T9SS type A sorting domain-containing protein [candidate division Zixibacteria bacterium]